MFPFVTQVAFQISAGQFEDFDEDPKTKITDVSETIFRKAMGTDPDWKINQESIAPVLAEISEINRSLSTKCVQDYSVEELIDARNELIVLAASFRGIILIGRIKSAPRESLASVTNLHDLFNPTDASDQTLVFWIWLLHRRTERGRRILERFKQFKAIAEENLATILLNPQLVDNRD
jgi:hypothetical protein